MNYVRIKFHPAGAKRPRWYWAVKLGEGRYMRCNKEGDTSKDGGKTPEGALIEKQELLMGKPIEERPAKMNLHYGWLEEA